MHNPRVVRARVVRLLGDWVIGWVGKALDVFYLASSISQQL